jgi:uncharacterized protein HemX
MWKYAAGAAGVALLAFALWLGIAKYGEAQFQAGQLSIAVEVAKAATESEKRALAEYQRGIEQGQAATKTFIEWREGPLRTVKETIYRDLEQYEQTVAGSAVCLDADGLSATNQNISAINATAYPITATGRTEAVPSDTGN